MNNIDYVVYAAIGSILFILLSLIIVTLIPNRKKPCQSCTEVTDNCVEGKYVCVSCVEQSAIKKEGLRECPLGHGSMHKELIEGGDIIIDRCKECNGVWLDADELEKIVSELNDGNGGNLAAGLAIGISTGIAIG